MSISNALVSRCWIVRSRLHRRRFGRFAVCLGLILAVAAGDAAAQDAGEKKLVIEDKLLTTGDGWQIHITYFQSPIGKEAPVVLLLHGKGGNRLVWGAKPRAGGAQGVKGFANRLQENSEKGGYAVISLDLRKHGQSKNPAVPVDLHPNDYQLMVVQDLEAVKKFIYAEHQAQRLNMRKLAIIAADMSAPIAINYALRDWLKRPHVDAPTIAARTPRGQDVRALVLLSPETSLPKLPTGRAIRQLRNPAWGISFLICVGAEDKFDKGQAKRIYRQLSPMAKNDKKGETRINLMTYAGRWRGTDLLGHKNRIEEHMHAFLEKYLKQLPDPWRNRKSR